jgi:L-seryl-tRNA(Ser) seleniumtransferase
MESVVEKVPTLRLLTLEMEELEDRANKLAQRLDEVSDKLNVEIGQGYSQVGGGAFPMEALATSLVKIDVEGMTANEIGDKLRNLMTPPLFTRIQSEKVIIDPRTIKDEEIDIITSHFKKVIERGEA